LVLALLADFSMRPLKQRLADWYVAIAVGDWFQLVRSAAFTSEDILARFLGRHLLSWSFVLRSFVLSTALGSIVSFLAAFYLLKNGFFSFINWWFFIRVIIVNGVIDTLCLAVTRYFLRLIAQENSNSAKSLFLTAALMANTWIAVTLSGASLTINAGHIPDLSATPTSCLFLPLVLFFAVLDLFMPGILHLSNLPPQLSADRWSVLAWVGLPACYSSILFVITVCTSFIIYHTRLFTRKPLMETVEFIDRLPRGAFGVIATLLDAISHLLESMQHK
jgi:hypothetical protein